MDWFSFVLLRPSSPWICEWNPFPIKAAKVRNLSVALSLKTASVHRHEIDCILLGTADL